MRNINKNLTLSQRIALDHYLHRYPGDLNYLEIMEKIIKDDRYDDMYKCLISINEIYEDMDYTTLYHEIDRLQKSIDRLEIIE